jgi:predicted HAD superfamily Cof-like phosphohydrolase
MIFDPIRDIADFHVKFGLAYTGAPRDIPPEIKEFRVRFMHEEILEYEHAQSRAEQLDALVDLMYVLLGTAVCSSPLRVLEPHAASMG